MTPYEEIQAANARFYDAFESLKIERMQEVWAKDNSIKCIHPGRDVLVGWKEVMDSWMTFFENTQYIEFNITNEHISVVGSMAWVVCTENILSSVDGRIVRSTVIATNIFEKRGKEWLMVHRHGSPLF